MLSPVAIHQPGSVAEASRLLAALGPDAAPYAGGTELLVLLKEHVAEVPHLVDLKRIPGLNAIRLDGDEVVIGALATHRQIERDPLVRQHLPLLAELEANVANLRVRHAGTLGGNLCFAEPHSDPATLLVAWDAEVVLESAADVRVVPLEEFFTGLLETVRAHDEVMTAVRIPLRPPGEGGAYERFKTHERPAATVAATLRLDGGVIAAARIVAGSVGDRPLRLSRAEDAPIGLAADATAFMISAGIAHDEVRPTADPFESEEYKRHLVRVLTLRALTTAAARAARGSHAG